MTVDNDLQALHLVLTPADPPDRAETDRLAEELRTELTLLDVESIGAGMSIRPQGHPRSTDPQSVCAIAVALSGTVGVLAALIAKIRNWLVRQHHSHRVAITVDGDTLVLDNTAGPHRERVAEFVDRHSTG
jgi:hypothetical protein